MGSHKIPHTDVYGPNTDIGMDLGTVHSIMLSSVTNSWDIFVETNPKISM